MSDDKRENNAEEQTFAEENPTSQDQEPESGQTKEEDQQKPSETETDASQDDTNEVEVPKDNAAWAKLRTENKRLKEALDESGVDAEYLQKLQAVNREQNPQYQPVQPISPDTDLDEVTRTINITREEALRARQELATFKNQIREQQDQQAIQQFPELDDKSDSFDPEFFRLVSERKISEKILNNRERPTLEVAKEVQKLLSKRDKRIIATTEEQTKQNLEQKAQAVAEARTTTTAGQSGMTDENVRMRARKGDRQAQTEIAKGIIADLDFGAD